MSSTRPLPDTIDRQASSDPASPPARRGGARRSWPYQVERFALVLILAALIVVFSTLRGSTFATVANVQVIVGSQSTLALIALAALVPLVANQYDLSVGSIAGLSSVVAATSMSRFHHSLFVAIVVALAFGVVCGLVNALVVTSLRVNSFVATVGMATILDGVIQAYTKGIGISSGISPTLTSLGTERIAGIPRSVFVAAAATLAVWYALEHTPFGRHLRAMGSSPKAARLVGIRTDAETAMAYVVSALLASAGGIVSLGVLGGANPSVGGVDYMLPALAAVFLGATAFTPGSYNALGTMVGLIFVAVGVSGLTLLGVSAWVQSVFNGAALIVAVATSAALLRRRRGAEPV